MPLPGPLVVKNGSVALASVASSMPQPVSLTLIRTYWPGFRPSSESIRAERRRPSRAMVSWPPSGMASRALMVRFSRASSSWLASARIGGRPVGKLFADLHQGAERALQQVLHPAHQLGDIDHLRLQLLPAGEGEQALGQRRAPFGAQHGVVEQPLRLGSSGSAS